MCFSFGLGAAAVIKSDICCVMEKHFHLLNKSFYTTEVTLEMLSLIDVLVDGEFVQDLKNISLEFRGSSNQRIIDVKKTLEAGEVVLYELKKNTLKW